MIENFYEHRQCSFRQGFIRAIDMRQREIHVIIPDGRVSKALINALVKGHDDCPDEFYYMAIDRVCHGLRKESFFLRLIQMEQVFIV